VNKRSNAAPEKRSRDTAHLNEEGPDHAPAL
jgi:hypothetical protein